MSTKQFFAPDKLAKIACECPDARMRMRAVAKLKDRLDFLRDCRPSVKLVSIDPNAMRKGGEFHMGGDLTTKQIQITKKFNFEYKISSNKKVYYLSSPSDWDYAKSVKEIVYKSKYEDSKYAALLCLTPEELGSVAINNEDYNVRLKSIRYLEKLEIDCIKQIRYKRKIRNKIDNFLRIFKILKQLPVIGKSKIPSKIRSYCIRSNPDLINSLKVHFGIDEYARYGKDFDSNICSIDLPFAVLKSIILKSSSKFSSDFKYEDSRGVVINSIKRIMPLIINYSGEHRDLDLEFLRDMCIDDENPKIRKTALETLILLYKRELRHKFDLVYSQHYFDPSEPSAKEKELVKIFGQICRHSPEGNEQIVREIVGFVVGKAPYVMNEYLFYCVPFRAENDRIAETFISELYEKLKIGNTGHYFGELKERLRERYWMYMELTETEKNEYRKNYQTHINYEFEDLERKKRESDPDIKRDRSWGEYVSRYSSICEHQIKINAAKTFFTIASAAKKQSLAETSLKILEIFRKSIKEYDDCDHTLLAFDKTFLELAQKSKFPQVRIEAEKILEGLDEKDTWKQEFLGILHKKKVILNS